VRRCVKGPYEPVDDAAECDSALCQWARSTKGTVAGSYDSYPLDHSSSETEANIPSLLLEPATSQWRWRGGDHHQIHLANSDPFEFFLDPRNPSHFISEAKGLDPLEESLSSPDTKEMVSVTIPEPKLDLSQVAAEIGLSPEDMDAILQGKPTGQQ